MSSLPPLPDGWTEVVAAGSNRPYYYNATTKQTTWSRPSAPTVSDVPTDQNNDSRSNVK
jgi:hypothetical protein